MSLWLSLVVVIIVILNTTLSHTHPAWPSSSTLHITPLSGSRLIASFIFVHGGNEESGANRHNDNCDVWFGSQGVKVPFHLAMTQGRPPTDLPPQTNAMSLQSPHHHSIAWKPVGLELIAPRIESHQQFRRLTHTLSGVFCASVNFLDVDASLTYAAGTVSARTSLHHNNTNHHLLYYGTLSRETVCTENLTPFKKLLPNRAKSGLALLLNPLKLFDSEYYSMQVTHDLLPNGHTRLTQRIDVIVDLLNGVGKRHIADWSLTHLFDAHLSEWNPLVAESKIYVHLNENLVNHAKKYSAADDDELYNISPKPCVVHNRGDAVTFEYDLMSSTRRLTNIEFSWNNKTMPVPLSGKQKPSITAHRYQSGYGLLDGGLTLTIENHDSEDVLVRYFEAIPWVFRVYFHTLELSINGTIPLKPFSLDFEFFSISPAEERKSPNEIEFALKLPARSFVVMRVHFEKVFLKYTEHPPDANRGFDLDSSLVMFCRPHSDKECSLEDLNMFNASSTHTRLYTESLLISLPTPDFSMPYNVIMLTSTLVVMFFGSLFNVLIRREEAPKDKSKDDESIPANER